MNQCYCCQLPATIEYCAERWLCPACVHKIDLSWVKASVEIRKAYVLGTMEEMRRTHKAARP